MDFVSHALWGGLAVGRSSWRAYTAAAALSILPDVLSEGVMFALAGLRLPGMPELGHGHPDITEFPGWAQGFYDATHSLVVFGLVFGAVWLWRRRPPWLLLAWGLHILIDIPTHSLALFPTPFLWPLSGVRVDGVPWGRAVVMVPNALLLATGYAVWISRRRAAAGAGR